MDMEEPRGEGRSGKKRPKARRVSGQATALREGEWACGGRDREGGGSRMGEGLEFCKK